MKLFPFIPSSFWSLSLPCFLGFSFKFSSPWLSISSVCALTQLSSCYKWAQSRVGRLTNYQYYQHVCLMPATRAPKCRNLIQLPWNAFRERIRWITVSRAAGQHLQAGDNVQLKYSISLCWETKHSLTLFLQIPCSSNLRVTSNLHSALGSNASALALALLIYVRSINDCLTPTTIIDLWLLNCTFHCPFVGFIAQFHYWA